MKFVLKPVNSYLSTVCNIINSLNKIILHITIFAQKAFTTLYYNKLRTRRKVNLTGYSQNHNSFAPLAQRGKAVALTV